MTATLHAILRDKLGSRWARRLRLQGRFPASIQGEGRDSLHLSLSDEEFSAARRHHEHVFSIEIDGAATETTMVREIQWDAFGDSIHHIEFRRVDLTRETEAEVNLEFVGHPKGGVLNHLVTHVTVRAVPTLIPDSIEVPVGELELGHPLLAKALRVPQGVTLVTPPETAIAVVVTIKEEVAAPAAAAEVPVAGAEGEAAPAADDKAAAAGAKGQAAPAKAPAAKAPPAKER
jgi:large subunit ribosomal protein L25